MSSNMLVGVIVIQKFVISFLLGGSWHACNDKI